MGRSWVLGISLGMETVFVMRDRKGMRIVMEIDIGIEDVDPNGDADQDIYWD